MRSLIFTPDGERLISGGFDGKIRIWNVETGESERTLSPATPLARMNITGVKGLTPGTIASLKALGAIEDKEVRSENVE